MFCLVGYKKKILCNQGYKSNLFVQLIEMLFEVLLLDIFEFNIIFLFCRFGIRIELEKKLFELNLILNKDINFFYLYINYSIFQNNILFFFYIFIVYIEDIVYSIYIFLYYIMF